MACASAIWTTGSDRRSHVERKPWAPASSPMRLMMRVSTFTRGRSFPTQKEVPTCRATLHLCRNFASTHRHNLTVNISAGTEIRPHLHHLPPAVEQRGALVRPLDCARYGMGQGHLS